MTGYVFRVLPERLAIARLPPDAPFPDWARGGFVNIARTPGEVSVVCGQSHVPTHIPHVTDRVALGIEGVLNLGLVGVLASICATLARDHIPVFVVSTHDTDWILIEADRLASARSALEAAGHRVVGTEPAP
ncbi:MAG: ACT domain-containing protein [Armatimonadota bacterium]